MGALNISAPKHERVIRLAERDEAGNAVAFSERAFSLTTQTDLVDRADLMRSGLEIQEWIINMLQVDPRICSVNEDPINLGYRVTRPAIIAGDIDEYEFLFDQRDFIPH
ncbi:hypothetical protein B7L88_gp089 [Rhizobium phage RHEph10]|uniref:hypothetical protein n=1 Tax=Rhizobium phage RHEph10 TaxID=1220717 RepID=UPI0002AB335D|nr:hypothetical protein B7L88_gp089 [Rhizobium phage RHEph10]AGC36199.1 hypothetical protein RHEph10_gp156 [Rhizobium phage RHEph10]